MPSNPPSSAPEEDFCPNCNRTVLVSSEIGQQGFKSACDNPYCPITGKLAATVGGSITGITVSFKVLAD